MDKNKCPNSNLKKKFIKNFPGRFLHLAEIYNMLYNIYKNTKSSSKINILVFRSSKFSFLDGAFSFFLHHQLTFSFSQTIIDLMAVIMSFLVLTYYAVGAFLFFFTPSKRLFIFSYHNWCDNINNVNFNPYLLCSGCFFIFFYTIKWLFHFPRP